MFVVIVAGVAYSCDPDDGKRVTIEVTCSGAVPIFSSPFLLYLCESGFLYNVV